MCGSSERFILERLADLEFRLEGCERRIESQRQYIVREHAKWETIRRGIVAANWRA